MMCHICKIELSCKSGHKTTCDKCKSDYIKKQQKAAYLVNRAIKKGDLIRGLTCELCNNDQVKIVAHHWNGYENPLDIWWICQRCNVSLPGPYFHSGKTTKKQAKFWATA